MSATIGDLVWLHHGTKLRPGVVMGICPDGRLFVLAGTSQPRPPPRVTVDPKTRAGKAWGLTVHTNFLPQPAIVLPAVVERVCAKCPKPLFFDLEEMLSELSIVIPTGSAPIETPAEKKL